MQRLTRHTFKNSLAKGGSLKQKTRHTPSAFFSNEFFNKEVERFS
jgi:hypothetical protein